MPVSAPDGSTIKNLDDYFRDWEGNTFGYGYGTGELFTLTALKGFFSCLRSTDPGEPPRSYDYRELEAALTPTVAWLMINILCKEGIINYGTSPRYAWIDPEGERLRDYLVDKSVDDLLTILNAENENSGYSHCYPDTCNCGPNGYEKDRKCPNPFWTRR